MIKNKLNLFILTLLTMPYLTNAFPTLVLKKKSDKMKPTIFLKEGSPFIGKSFNKNMIEKIIPDIAYLEIPTSKKHRRLFGMYALEKKSERGGVSGFLAALSLKGCGIIALPLLSIIDGLFLSEDCGNNLSYCKDVLFCTWKAYGKPQLKEVDPLSTFFKNLSEK